MGKVIALLWRSVDLVCMFIISLKIKLVWKRSPTFVKYKTLQSFGTKYILNGCFPSLRWTSRWEERCTFTSECSHSCLKPSSFWLSNTGADPAGIWRRGGSSESGPSSHGALQPFGGSMEPPSADVGAAGERRHQRALPGCSLTR